MPHHLKAKTSVSAEEKEVVFNAASPEQVAEIHALLKQNETLLRQYLTPYSTALSMFIPLLLYKGLLAPGRLFNPVYESIINSEAARYLTGYHESMHEAVAHFNHAGENYRLLMKNIETRQFISKTAVQAANNAANAAASRSASAISAAYQQALVTANSFKPGSTGLQELESTDFFESLDALSTAQGYQRAKIAGSLALRSLISQFKSVEEVLEYKEYFLSVIKELAGNSDHSVWSKSLTEAVKVSYVPSVYHKNELTQRVHDLVPATSNKGFRELFRLLQDGHNAQIKSALLVHHHTQQHGRQHMATMNKTATNIGKLYARKWFLLGATAAGMLGKSYIADPLVASIYNRFFEHPLPLGSDKLLIQKDEAAKIIEQLKKRNQLLLPKAKRNISFSRYLSLLIIPVFIYYTFISGDISPEFAIFAFCTFVTALSNSKQEFSDWYAAKRFENELAERRSHWGKAINNYAEGEVQVWENSGETSLKTLNSCYFLIRAAKYQSVDTFIVCQIIKEAFLKQGVDIISYGPRLIAVAGDSKIDAVTADRINHFIKVNLERVNGITQLRRQLSKLNNEINKDGQVISRPQRDDGGERVNQFIFLVPEQYQEFITTEKLSEIFNSNSVEVRTTDKEETTKNTTNYLRITIIGYSPADERKFDNLISSIRHLKRSLPSDEKLGSYDSFSSALSSSNDLSQRTPKAPPVSAKTLDTDSKVGERSTTKTIPSSTIKWKSGVYDLKATESNVIPLESRYLPRNKFFTFFALDEKDFPDERSYAHFKSKAERSKLAAQEGDEGVLFIDEMVRDTHGAFFRARAKLKVKGTYGDMRVYAAEEQSNTGEMLYVFKGINAHTH